MLDLLQWIAFGGAFVTLGFVYDMEAAILTNLIFVFLHGRNFKKMKEGEKV